MHQLHPKIYVACLAAYHSGKLHSEWIGANQFVEKIQMDIEEILSIDFKNYAKDLLNRSFFSLRVGIKLTCLEILNF